MAESPMKMPRRFGGAFGFSVTCWNDSRYSKSVDSITQDEGYLAAVFIDPSLTSTDVRVKTIPFIVRADFDLTS
jgi:hypothetical protein